MSCLKDACNVPMDATFDPVSLPYVLRAAEPNILLVMVHLCQGREDPTCINQMHLASGIIIEQLAGIYLLIGIILYYTYYYVELRILTCACTDNGGVMGAHY